VFDGVLDNRYDQEPNHTFRWIKLCESIQAAKKTLPELFEQCRADIEHNQQLFQSSKAGRLNKLLESINEQHR
jgi:geranylgeranyl pyrophosphate synthase